MGATHNLKTDEQGRSGQSSKKAWRLAVGLVCLALFCLLGFASFVVNRFVVRHNFHVVSDGLVYRSGQFDAPGLTQTVQEHGIKSILNLRGGASPDGWYNAETNTAHRLGVQYFDYELSASEVLTDAQLDHLVNVLENAPKPLLIHCKSGADRTGLAGALYLYSLEGKPADVSGQELKLLYGHVPYLFWHDTAAMDKSFNHYVATHAPGSGRNSASRLTRQDTAKTSALVN